MNKKNKILYLTSYILNPQRGLTLIEIIISIGILVVIGTIGTGAFSSFKKSSDLVSAADIVVNNLIQARSKTLSAEEAKQYGVHFETDKIVFYSGTTYIAGASDNKETTLPKTIEISSVALNGGGADTLFKKLTGETDNDGVVTVRLKSDTSKTKTIHIRPVGLTTVE
ncbi:MAG: prepilin-type N-terminal cleavage/methylation domain-containing protein [Parcubacteria group bacterium]|nr:prepilin-type N-terminal cleavage/methylation domain-containing protein [Parcubacteria group bacterium]